MFSVLALIVPFAAAVVASSTTIVPDAQAAGLTNLCESTQGVCIITSVEAAPVLRADVCHDGVTTTLMGSTGCGSSSRAYHLTHGIVDNPITNTVLPFQPVIDTCVAGFCVPDQIDPGDVITDGVACCNPKTGVCQAPNENGLCTVGDITWCEKVEDNGDGTITCHE